jgi:hypothetical protein
MCVLIVRIKNPLVLADFRWSSSYGFNSNLTYLSSNFVFDVRVSLIDNMYISHRPEFEFCYRCEDFIDR